MDLHLSDKVVIVTGGTQGHRRGHRPQHGRGGGQRWMVNRPGLEGPAIEAEMTGKGYRVTYLAAELTEIPECRRVVDTAMARFGRIDVIVNNAGFNSQLDLRSDPDVFMKGLRDNLIHYYALVHYAHDTLIENRGNVVNIGSHVSITGQGHTSAYVAAKGAIDGLTREWAAYFCDSGVRVNCLVPGSVWTSSYTRWASQFPDPEERRRMAERNIPLGRRMTTIEEFADMVVFVASERASHLTGQIIVNDGGYCHLDRVLT